MPVRITWRSLRASGGSRADDVRFSGNDSSKTNIESSEGKPGSPARGIRRDRRRFVGPPRTDPGKPSAQRKTPR